AHSNRINMADQAEMNSALTTAQEIKARTIERFQGASPIDDKIYRELVDAMAMMRSSHPIVSDCAKELEATLFAEARLLDERRYREWLGMLTDDFVYWVPATSD